MAGTARELLDPVAPRHGRVRARPAGDEVHALDRLRDLGRDPDLFGDDVALGQIDAAAQRVLDRARLLVDFLEHEVLVAALLGLRGRPVDRLGGAAHRRAGDRRDLGPAARQRGHLAVVQEDDLARVRQHRGDVARAEHLALAQADDQRAVGLGDDDLVGRVGADYRDGVRAADLTERAADGVDEAGGSGAERFVDEVRDDLGVRIAAEAHALGLELAAQGHVVLDDPVVDDGDLAGDVGVRIGLARTPVRRPARVADAGRARQRALLESRLEVHELADRSHDLDAASGVQREARGVVPAIFQAPQPLDEDGGAVLGSDVANDAAHEAYL